MNYQTVTNLISIKKKFPEFVFDKKFNHFSFFYFDRVFCVRDDILLFGKCLHDFIRCRQGKGVLLADIPAENSEAFFIATLKSIPSSDDFSEDFFKTLRSDVDFPGNASELMDDYFVFGSERPVIFDIGNDDEWIIYFDRGFELGIIAMTNSARDCFENTFTEDYKFHWENLEEYLEHLSEITFDKDLFEKYKKGFLENYLLFVNRK